MSFLDDFAAIINSGVSNKGPVGKLRGKDLSESVTDAPQLKKFEGTEPSRVAAEAEALTGPTIGPISIDPTDYLTPGGLAKVGAAVTKTLTGAAASPMLVGAFRSANNTMLSRRALGDARAELDKESKALLKYKDDGMTADEMQQVTFLGKVSDKEIAKYGTPEFLLDKWLSSTIWQPGRAPSGIKPITTADVIDEGANLMHWNTVKAEVEKVLPTIPDDQKPILLKTIAQANDSILKSPATKLVEDFGVAQKQSKELLDSNFTDTIAGDIDAGVRNLRFSLMDHKIPFDVLEGKSLQQIVSVAHKADDELVKIYKKSMEHKTKVITTRTAELFNTQRDPDAGMFIKLTDPKDLAHETDILNHCLGAVGRDNGKYIPAFDTVTGKINPKTSAGNTSFDQYNLGMQNGTSEFYSYRPTGLPEVTLEVKVSQNSWGGGHKYVAQAYGKEDAALTAQQADEVKRFAQAKGITFNRSAHTAEDIVDDVGNVGWVPDDDIPF
jgi:hypothetical protein